MAMAASTAGRPARLNLSTMEFDLPVDEKKVRAIHACLSKGRLKISVSKVDLAAGRLGDGYKYD
jgi:hypothetical protein